MFNLSYEFAKLRTDYYLGGVQERYKTGKRVPLPNYIIWDCTRRCNLSCTYCGAARDENVQEMTTEQIKFIIDQLAGIKRGMFAVTGGEPLLRKDLPEVLAHAILRGLKTGIATNGYSLDQATAKWIQEIGVHSVQVSLDGPEKTHNSLRGNEESFARAVEAIENLTRLKVPLVSVATTVTAYNLQEIDALRLILLHLGIKLWRLAVVMPIGRAQSLNNYLDGKGLTWLLNYVRENDSGNLHIYIGENLTFLGSWEKQIRNGPAICPIGFTACCIGVDGSLRGCPEQGNRPENREGSLLETSFQQIWQEGFGRYRERNILKEDEKCFKCGSQFDCFGGCWVMRRESRHCIYEMLSTSAQNPSDL